MSQIVDTSLGRFRHVQGRIGDSADLQKWWLWECPRCKQWGGLSDGQWNGTVSVNCDAENHCGYHETHPFGATLVAAIQANILTCRPPSHEDTDTQPRSP